MLIGLDGFLVGGEGDVGPGSSLLMNGCIGIDDVPLRSLFLHELFDFVGESGGIFIWVSLDPLEVKDI